MFVFGPQLHQQVPYLITYLNRTPIFEQYVVRSWLQELYKIDMGIKKFGLHAQNMLIIQ